MPSKVTICIEHNAEMAHRLPILPGKCQNLHGHSWKFKFFIEAPLDEHGVSVEYGIVKKSIRDFIDTYWDHGTMLGVDDPLVHGLLDDPYHTKTWVVGGGKNSALNIGFKWPTVEAIAVIAGRMANSLLANLNPEAKCVCVSVHETDVNSAIWEQQ